MTHRLLLRNAVDWWLVAFAALCIGIVVVTGAFVFQQCEWQERCEKSGGRVVEYDCEDVVTVVYINDMPVPQYNRSCSQRCEGVDHE